MSLTEWVHDLYTKNAEKLYKIAFYRLGRNADLAEDVVQDTYLVLLMKAEQVRHYECPEAWLMQTLNYNIKHILQKQAKQKERELPLDNVESTTSYEDSPSGLQEILPTKLSNEDRQLLELYYEQQLPYDKIAEILDIPIGTVGSRLLRLKKKLKNFYSEGNKSFS